MNRNTIDPVSAFNEFIREFKDEDENFVYREKIQEMVENHPSPRWITDTLKYKNERKYLRKDYGIKRMARWRTCCNFREKCN